MGDESRSAGGESTGPPGDTGSTAGRAARARAALAGRLPTAVAERLPPLPESRRGRLVLVAVAAVLLVAVVALLLSTVLAPGPTPTVEEVPSRPAVVVAVAEDGSARVMAVRTYNLSNATERDAFRDLETTEAARERAKTAFEREMRSLADRAARRTDRSMRVHEPAIRVERRDGTGVVAVSVRWENLATRRGDELVVSEPFAGGYDPGRPLLLQAPAGYTVVGATPGMDGYVDRTATWRPPTDLGDFRAVLAPEAPVVKATQQTPQARDPVLVPVLGWGPTEVGLFVVIVALEAVAYVVYRRMRG